MIKHFNKENNSEYFTEVYDFKGQWDVPSRCGLKIVKNNAQTIVIATELYAENPGTSVTNFCAPLATQICSEFAIDHNKVIFIVHTPDAKSKLTFLNESFFQVDFSWTGSKFTDPKWAQIEKTKVDELIGIPQKQ
ncbi:MAG TPA: hypothetical protein PKL96_09715 [Bacteroidales bacterium]|nr:hypothetical protein [Bacteroidales bacterium]HPS28056.1 hypothetical protein [Bacteroidales bacterium]